MNALFLYSEGAGHGQFVRHKEEVLKLLGKRFEKIDVVETSSAEEATKLLQNACGVYDAAIVAGGDGTFHNAANALARKENAPVLGYFNSGSTGDTGYNFGATTSWKKDCKVITEGKIKPMDLIWTNKGCYFTYVAAVGCYAPIPYEVPREKKKKWGVFAYYGVAARDVFRGKMIHAKVECDGQSYESDCGFIMALNGCHVGGVYVNRPSNPFDHKMEIVYTKTRFGKGALDYVAFRHNLRTVEVRGKAKIATDSPLDWDFDGERIPAGDLEVELIPNAIRVFSLR